MTQPLFAGGVIDSQIRQQIQRQASARMQTENARRTMVQQIGQAWSEYLANHENQTNADQAVQANQVAYDGMQKERQADLRSTLEVLYIEQALRQSELLRASAYHDSYVSQTNLLGAMGLLEASLIAPGGVDIYDGAIEAISADLPIVLLPRPAPTRRQPARLLEFAPRTALNAVALACVLLGAYQVRRGRLFGAALENAWNAFNALRDMKAPGIAAALLAGGAVQAARGHVLSPAASLVYYALSLLRPRGAAEKSG